MDNTNLLIETLNKLNLINKAIEDIDYINMEDCSYNVPSEDYLDYKSYYGVSYFTTIWSEFEFYSEKYFKNYDSGYGGVIVPNLTTIVFKDNYWLERWQYDGSEGWDYKRKPERILKINKDNK